MKTIIIELFFPIIFVITLSNNAFAQQNKINPGERPAPLESDIPPEKSFVPQREISVEEKKLTDRLMHAKESGSGEEMLEIQKQIDSYAGSVTMQGIEAGKTERMYGSLAPEQNISGTKVLGGINVLSMALQKEQIGTSNRLWAIIAGAHSQTDTLYTLYSDDEGVNWNFFSRSWFTSAYIGNEIDAEIVQTPTGKYLYVVCNLYLINSSKNVIGLVVIGSSDFFSGSSTQLLMWPGEDLINTTVIKYRPRITSDCAAYQYSNAWIYIVCCQDSVVPGGSRTCVKAARINNPYMFHPSVTYKSEPFYFNDFVTNFFNSHCDLAFHNDGSLSSITVVQSNIPTTSYVYLTKSGIANFTSFASYSGALNGGTSRKKTYAYISSNGNYNNLMITNTEEYSLSDLDIQYFNSTNAGLSWTTGYVDYTANFSYRADITERKNIPGEFYLAYGDGNSTFSSVHFCKATTNVWGTVVPQMNHLNSQPVNVKSCYKTSGSENCMALWAQSGSQNVWISSGCSGSPVQTKNLTLKIFIQGRYFPATDFFAGDTLTVQLRNTVSPYSVISTAKSYQHNNGVGNYNFVEPANGVNYYIVVKHRNSIETWSRTPGQSFVSNALIYNFYTWAQAYGGNLVEVDDEPYRFGIYTGDVNQDGVIEATDVALVDNDAANFVTGYVPTDLTGGYVVDGSDYAIADNNAFNFVSVIKP